MLKHPFRSGFASLCGVALVAGGFLLPPAAAAEMPEYTVEIKDGVVTPQEIRVKAGTTFKIVIRNTGKGPAEFESRRLRKEKVLGPGVETFLVIRRLSPGRYEYFDEFHMNKSEARGVIVAE